MQGKIQRSGQDMSKLRQLIIHGFRRNDKIKAVLRRDPRKDLFALGMILKRFVQYRTDAGDRGHAHGDHRDMKRLFADCQPMIAYPAAWLYPSIVYLDDTVDAADGPRGKRIHGNDHIRMIYSADALDDASAFQAGLPHDPRRKYCDVACARKLLRMSLGIKM